MSIYSREIQIEQSIYSCGKKIEQSIYLCTNMSCTDPATATVLVGATRMPKCFTHEREYADRYGAADIHALRIHG